MIGVSICMRASAISWLSLIKGVCFNGEFGKLSQFLTSGEIETACRLERSKERISSAIAAIRMQSTSRLKQNVPIEFYSTATGCEAEGRRS